MAEPKDLKQGEICQLFIELGNASEAYRQAFHAERIWQILTDMAAKACEPQNPNAIKVTV